MEYFAYSQKAFVYKYVVMASDLDQFGHMSFANYLRLMFLASDALFLAAPNRDLRKEIRLRAVKTGMQFKDQTGYGDEILVKVSSSNPGKTAFSLLYTYVIEGSGHLVGLGRQEFELSDKQKIQRVSIPSSIQALLEPIQVNEKYLVYRYK